MAESHPVGFRWVMAAKERGATIMHVDPHFSRTSQQADIFAHIRVGTDIAFLGGLINYVLQNELYFKEYVQAYTNATFLVRDEYRDAEDLDGVFSGLKADHSAYDAHSWQYKMTDAGELREQTGDSACRIPSVSRRRESHSHDEQQMMPDAQEGQ